LLDGGLGQEEGNCSVFVQQPSREHISTTVCGWTEVYLDD